MMPTWLPVKLIASTPRSLSAIVSSAAETRSPVVSSMSISRPGCVVDTELASAIRLSVDLPIAETATTTSLPCRRVNAMCSATARIRSGSATEVPPYFWTMRATGPTRYRRPGPARHCPDGRATHGPDARTAPNTPNTPDGRATHGPDARTAPNTPVGRATHRPDVRTAPEVSRHHRAGTSPSGASAAVAVGDRQAAVLAERLAR